MHPAQTERRNHAWSYDFVEDRTYEPEVEVRPAAIEDPERAPRNYPLEPARASARPALWHVSTRAHWA